jgi:hypothetical protein
MLNLTIIFFKSQIFITISNLSFYCDKNKQICILLPFGSTFALSFVLSSIFMKYIFSTTLLFLFSLFVRGQVDYDKTNFAAPMNIKMVLAGNFAEMRSNHFHTGLDIKTNHKEGYEIYAIDTGYVSRINYSHWGYGRAIYVRHPNGYTSVYAHLSKFPKHIEEYVRKRQFENQKETFEYYPSKSRFLVSKGEVIAYSGNSGSSTAPHLHFEIRETATEKPVNPLLFNFDIADTKKPVLLDVKLYPMEGDKVNGKEEPYNLDLKGSDGIYEREYSAPVIVQGRIGFAINTIDYLDGAGNKCGIYSIELLIDNKLKFKQKLDKLEFKTNRYINTHSDYLEYRLNKQSYHKSFVSQNNKLDIYEEIEGDGTIFFNDTLEHHIQYIVKDTYGNTSTVHFNVQANYSTSLPGGALTPDNYIFATKSNTEKQPGFEATLPANTLYEDLKYDYEQSKMNNTISPVFEFHNDHIPVHQYFVLKLKTQPIKKELEGKAVLVEVSKNRRRVYAKGGEYKDGWITGKVRSFGDYTVKLDTVAPVVTLDNFKSGQNVANLASLDFKISDNLSGIETYDIYIDGKWKLAKYTPRKAALSLPFDSYNKIGKGTHKLKIVVTDERGNITEMEVTFLK